MLIGAAYERISSSGGTLHILAMPGLGGRGVAAAVSVPGRPANEAGSQHWGRQALVNRPNGVLVRRHERSDEAPLRQICDVAEKYDVGCVVVAGGPIPSSKFWRWLASASGDILCGLSGTTHTWELVAV